MPFWNNNGRGPSGQNGEDGQDGSTGLSAYQIALANGFVGTVPEWLNSLKGVEGQDGENGLDGADGDSAFQVAVSNGFVGNQAAWLESLRGSDGIDGEDGVDGANGTNGSAATVSVGTVTTGAAAVTNVGTSSDAVLNFTVPKGDKGDKGDQGDPGSAAAVKRAEFYTLTTDASGNATQSFSPAFTNPFVTVARGVGVAASTLTRITALSGSSVTIKTERNDTASLLGTGLIPLASYVNVPSVSVHIKVEER